MLRRHDRIGVDIIRTDDTLVTLSVDPEMKLEDRLDLLTYAFAKWVQGAKLKKICSWDIAHGSIKFIVAEGPYVPGPRGTVSSDLSDAGVAHATQRVA